MTNKPTSICLKSAFDKQMQISSKSDGSFLPKMGWVVKIFSCIVWSPLNQPNSFVNESVYILRGTRNLSFKLPIVWWLGSAKSILELR